MRLAPLVALSLTVPVAVAFGQTPPIDQPPDAPLEQPKKKKLGVYERQALSTALEMKKLELADSAEGKRINDVHVVNLDVFSRRDGFLQWFNIFHVTTQPFRHRARGPARAR